MARVKSSRRIVTPTAGEGEDRTQDAGRAVDANPVGEASPRPSREVSAKDLPKGGSKGTPPLGTRVATYERSITRPVNRTLSTFAGAVQIRKEIALALLDDGLAWARRVFQEAAQDPKNQYLGHLSLATLELILNKTLGTPKEPYDEASGPPGVQTDRVVIQEATKVLGAMDSAPLTKYLEIAEKGIVKTPELPDGEPDQSGH